MKPEEKARVKIDQWLTDAGWKVINRDEFSEEDMAEKISKINAIFRAEIYIVHCPKVDVSSTELRNKLDRNDVLPAVYNYICDNDLYGN